MNEYIFISIISLIAICLIIAVVLFGLRHFKVLEQKLHVVENHMGYHENAIRKLFATIPTQLNFNNDATLIDSTPIVSTLIDTTPIDSTPIDLTPIDSTLIDTTPIDSTLIDTTPIDTTLIDTDSSINDDEELDKQLLDEIQALEDEEHMVQTGEIIGDHTQLLPTFVSEIN